MPQMVSSKVEMRFVVPELDADENKIWVGFLTYAEIGLFYFFWFGWTC